MKAFAFRLDQALRWRDMQVQMQKARVAAASARLSGIGAAIEARQTELLTARLSDDSTGATLEAYGAFRQRTKARVSDLESQAVEAQRTLGVEMSRLVEANQKLKLVENLKDAELSDWRREFDREVAAFADEIFLTRYNQKSRRARSSGG